MSVKEDSDMVDELQVRLYGPDGKLKESRDSTIKIRWYHVVLGLIILVPWIIWEILKKLKSFFFVEVPG